MSRRITRTHPAFECFTLIDDWTTRSRVLTYTKKNSGLALVQNHLETSLDQGIRDVLFLSVKIPNNPYFTKVNIYNTPSGATNPGFALNFLFSMPSDFLFKDYMLAGEFNLHRNNWQPSLTGSASQ